MSQTVDPLPVGVCVLPPRPPNAARTVAYAPYIQEILTHAGIAYTWLLAEELKTALYALRVLVTVGDTPLPNNTRNAVCQWVENGGAWLAIGGTAGCDVLFGVHAEPATYSGWGAGIGTLGEGYLRVQAAAHPVLQHIPLPLHFFNGIPVRATTGKLLAGVLDAHQRDTARAALVENRVGNGRCMLIAPDVTGSVVRVQQGVAVTRDGVPSPDGTAPICDAMLKSSDGTVLDWWFDRQPVEGVHGLSAFLQPIADIWREVVVRAICYLAQEQQVVLPVLWLYPRNLPAIAHLSHDTDNNDPALGERMLQVVRQAGIHSTWCVIPPGYPQAIIERIRAEGHELAMHFDAVSEHTLWDEVSFHEQWRMLTDLFGGQAPTTNKNHYLRWEGDTELFEWCQRRGILLDQSKGCSKTGEAGFTFGTCHPYFPVSPDGQLLDVLELPTLSQDLNLFAPEELLEPLLQAVQRQHGVLHLLFHPAHIDKPGIADTLLHAVQAAREGGMEWWIARQISHWERARRQTSWCGYTHKAGSLTVRLQSQSPLREATILLALPADAQVNVNGQMVVPIRTVRWGFEWSAILTDVEDEVTLQARW